MATNYKIKLKRFNGTDYDTLNLLSENIIMNTGNSLQSDIIPNTNGMLKNNDGIFEIANLGSDYTSIDDTLDSSVVKTYSIDKIKNLDVGEEITDIEQFIDSYYEDEEFQAELEGISLEKICDSEQTRVIKNIRMYNIIIK